jgi:hypothetical protein
MTHHRPRPPTALALVLVLALAILTGPAAAADVRLTGAELRTPSDSHEPQRARAVLRNDGSAARTVVVVCTFADEAGRTLERVEARAPALAAGAQTVAEPIYYGWPRASRVTCAIEERG